MKTALYHGNIVDYEDIEGGRVPSTGPFTCPECKGRVVYRPWSNYETPIFAHSPPNIACSLSRGGEMDIDWDQYQNHMPETEIGPYYYPVGENKSQIKQDGDRRGPSTVEIPTYSSIGVERYEHPDYGIPLSPLQLYHMALSGDTWSMDMFSERINHFQPVYDQLYSATVDRASIDRKDRRSRMRRIVTDDLRYFALMGSEKATSIILEDPDIDLLEKLYYCNEEFREYVDEVSGGIGDDAGTVMDSLHKRLDHFNAVTKYRSSVQDLNSAIWNIKLIGMYHYDYLGDAVKRLFWAAQNGLMEANDLMYDYAYKHPKAKKYVGKVHGIYKKQRYKYHYYTLDGGRIDIKKVLEGDPDEWSRKYHCL